ncbi:hypothetical protein J2X06_000278 [Lysobacter niastensis]|uniref:Uncharacterized protein n=1 Tax=Lysobacter niastensis TaxID=380629 RepID=A0ABU1W685_9GAMM|nr:hypothetical protein [Lysobacter niastensis]MDR7133094.1 hypothetical protein [Lysobacter niastensis]
MFNLQRAGLGPRALSHAGLAMLLAATVVLGACRREAPAPPEVVPGGPAEAVTQLVGDLRRNDLVSYARHAIPPTLHVRMETAWGEGRTVWPLTELPLDDRLQGFIAALAAPDAEKRLASVYDRQFAGQSRELHSAAATLGLFGVQYVRREGDYSDDERAHYAQLLTALSQWGQQAPLGDAARARKSIPQLVNAARLTGLAGADAFRRAGMERSLRRLGPFFARFKQVMEGYGLDLDEALDGVQVVVEEQTSDRARVRLNYTMAGQAIEARVDVERREGRWYLSDILRHAQAEAAASTDTASR